MTPIVRAALAAMLVVAMAPIQTSRLASASLPPKLQIYLTTVVKATSGDRERLQTGAPVTKLLDTDASKEIAVFGAIWIDAAIARYVEAVQDIESFERGGGFLVTRRISTPPALEDFADLRLPEEDVADLRTCTVGDCEVKLDQQALERFRSEIDWEAADAQASADAVMRQLVLDYVTGYLEGGNERLAVYRDGSRPTFVAEEFRAMVDRMPELTVYMPDMRQYLLEFPKITLPDSTSFLYWQHVEFGLKPTLRISHMTIRRGSDETIVASKMLYASHYFWTGLELRVLVPDPARGDGFWFVTVSRSRTGGLGGLKGLFVRRRVRSEVRNATQAVLSATKLKLEQRR